MDNNTLNINQFTLEQQTNSISQGVISYDLPTTITSAFRVDTLAGTANLNNAFDYALQLRNEVKDCIETDVSNLSTIGREFGILDDQIIN